MSLSKAMRFVSVFFLAVAVVLSAASMKAAEAGTPEVTMKVNDGVTLKDETIKLSEGGQYLILEDGTHLKVNLNDADKLTDEKVDAKATYPISGSLGAGQYKTWGLYCSAGSQSTFSSTWSPSASEVLVGIVDKFRCVEMV